MKRRINGLIIAFALLLTITISFLSFGKGVKAANPTYSTYNPIIRSYESEENYTIEGDAATALCFGKKSLGSIRVSGVVYTEGTFNGIKAYETNTSLSIKYNVESLPSDYGWTSVSDSSKSVLGVNIGEKIQEGIIILQKSSDNVNWETVNYVRDILDQDAQEYSLGSSKLEDNVKGTFYRVLLAYKLKKDSVTNFCTEASYFYICSASANCVKMIDQNSRVEISSGGSCEYGFIVDKGGSDCSVKVTKPDGSIAYAGTNEAFNEKGAYSISASTPLKTDTKNFTINVTTGLKKKSVITKVSEDSATYNLSSYTNSPTYCSTSYSKVSVGVLEDARIKTNDLANNLSMVGVTGSSTFLYIKLDPNKLMNNYVIVNDEYGKYETEKIGDMTTGQIDSGCLVVKKSSDNIDWSFCTSGPYSNGIYTTDFSAQFGEGGDIYIYSPSGRDILDGIYLQILYIFKVKNTQTDEVLRVVETHNIYLCSDNIDAITFNNMTGSNQYDIELEGMDAATIDIYKKAVTLINDSETSDGFFIFNELNPTCTITIKKNGGSYTIPSDMIISESGRYDITIQSKLGTIKNLTIFVNKYSFSELCDRYFSNNILTGKRIYSEGDYPVYEEKLTSYKINGVSDNYEKLWGTLEIYDDYGQLTYSESINSGSSDLVRQINYYGFCKIVLNTNKTFNTDTPSGDNHKFTFQFEMREEGTAPGPIVNKRELGVLAKTSNPTNFNPVYYGVTYSSAGKGNITMAFADYNSAYQYAYDYESGVVEVQSDGTYRYTGSFLVKSKTRIESNWDLMDAIDYFAKEAVETLYFDLSDEFTYITLSDDTIKKTNNIRTLELEKSVVILGESELEKILIKSDIPLVNSRRSAIILDKDANIYRANTPFVFVKDENGYDSYSIKIIDCNGIEYTDVKYNQSVEDQLNALNVPSGIITIEESTIYGDKTTYQAIFIKENENGQVVTLDYEDGLDVTRTINQSNEGLILNVNKFIISSIVDELDPNGLVIVSYNDKVEPFVLSNLPNKVWFEKGEYTIKFVNRLGYCYSIKLIIEEEKYNYVTINDGTVETNLYSIDDVIILKALSKKGYDFIGYKDEVGNVYNNEVKVGDLTDNAILTAAWSPKQ